MPTKPWYLDKVTSMLPLSRLAGYKSIIICVLLVALTSLAYWQVKDSQFITCDDDMYVYENPQVRAGLTWEGVKWSFTAFHSANWHPLTRQPLGARIADALVAYVTYGVKLFWPYPMAVFSILSPVPCWQAVGAGLALLSLSALQLYGARQYPLLPAGGLWRLGTPVPFIGLVQVGGQAMADRYTYIPYIGLFIILAWGV